MKKILYKLTSRSRPKRCEQTISSIVGNSSTDKDYLILLSCDEDDETMKDFSYDFYTDGRLLIKRGYSKNKIDAINRDLDDLDYDWDILVNVSDDMIIEKGFDSVVRSAFQDSLDLFLHLPDGYANERLATMSIMGKDYYKRFGYIYHPSYESVYCDNEAMDVAKILNKYAYVNSHVFKHIHPANVGAHLMDEQYLKTEASDVHARDCQNYQLRKAKNFEA
jgi:hypothetical protein